MDNSANLLAVMFVTVSATAGIANLVFRYPPVPRRADRLSRPVYGKRGLQDGVSTAGGKAGDRAGAGFETGLSQDADWAYRKNKGQAYDSDDSLDEQYQSALWQPLHVTSQQIEGGEGIRPRRQKPRRPGDELPNSSSAGQGAAFASNAGKAGGNADPTQVGQTISGSSHGSGGFNIAEYENCLGYETSFLNQILQPRRSACHKKFELVVDDLAFIGHPVCADESGKWIAPPDDEEEPEEPERGRGRELDRPGSRTGRALAAQGSTLSSVTEGVASDTKSEFSSATYVSDQTSGSAHPEPQPESQARGQGQRAEKDSSHLTFFHLVLVVDKPDPELEYDSPGMAYDLLYREIAFKWTAAAFAEQIRCDWVAEECKKLSTIKDAAYLNCT